MKRDATKRDVIYLAGSYYDWRDEFIDVLADFDIADPRQHRQSAIAKLVEDDMNSAQGDPILLAYFPKGKSRGTMTYAEIGASRAKGNCIITIDEETPDPLFSQVVSYSFTKKEDAFTLLRSGKYGSLFEPIKPEPEEFCKSVFFAGDLENMQELIVRASENKRGLQKYDASRLENFSKDVDITVVNFDSDNRSREAVFYMGLSYALDIPVIFCTSNKIPYPPLPGLARRTFTGKEKLNILKDYLTQLGSQDIEEEARIMYALMKKYDSEELNFS